ncbi:SDR family oxidoreductase [Plectonema cf. radiosum LEGE 06105]|uniref:SDR family oxidoreductase n=1 Tax=Plectonema cf. radiosum LEGE 06105 TaxID=945769 RepID=A0A8J7JW09_9CYAN|nr:SDR family oxidoreductase [Plectonema radiosum]MBE9215110.1 SDR family oxidoreductase [Plectonema cf. radiosum LEGE 06105]
MPSAIITGGSQGIGKSSALLFARKGYDLILTARSPEILSATAAEVSKIGTKVLAIPCDVSQEAEVNILISKALESFGSIDVLINNAGVCMTGPIEHTSLSDWHRVIDVNLWGYIHTIHALLPHFLQRQKGTIVNVGSIGGKLPLPEMTVYCTSKYAITGLTETLRLELKPKGIHVSAVHPSATDSNFMERAQFRGSSAQEAEKRRNSMSNFLKSPAASKPEDVADAIWNAVKHQKDEIVVGSGSFMSAAYKFFPGLMQFAMQTSKQ